jgi:hypothetical protein
LGIDLLECAETNENFLKSTITGDEAWLYNNDPTPKNKSNWKTFSSSQLQKAQVCSKIKVMLIVLLDYNSAVQHQYASKVRLLTAFLFKSVDASL